MDHLNPLAGTEERRVLHSRFQVLTMVLQEPPEHPRFGASATGLHVVHIWLDITMLGHYEQHDMSVAQVRGSPYPTCLPYVEGIRVLRCHLIR